MCIRDRILPGGSAPERPDTFYLNEHVRSTVGHSLSSNIFHGVFCTIMTVLSGGTTLLNDGLWHMKHMHDEEDEEFSAEMCAKILRRLEDPPVRSRRRAVKGLVKAFKDDDMLAEMCIRDRVIIACSSPVVNTFCESFCA